MEFHPVANIFPMMSRDEFDRLKESIRLNGQKVPIYTHGGRIVDGRNRFLACQDLAVAPWFEEWDGDGLLVDFVWALNADRRQLTDGALQIAAGKYAIERESEAKKRQLSGLRNVGSSVPIGTDDDFEKSRQEAAKKFGIGERTVARAVRLIKSGAPELVEAVQDNRASVTAAADVATLPADQQREIIAKGEAEILKAAKEIRAKKAEENAQRRAEVKARDVIIPQGKYRCIVIDPPWPMEKIERDERPNQVGFEYPTMTEDELKAFPLPDVAADDCHLYLWTTHKFLPMALRLAEHWGFRYQCVMTWVKNVGFTPFSWMYSTEHVLFCRKGNLQLERMGMRLDFAAKVREHSRKPDEFYEIVRQVSQGPRIDIFSREARDGFAQWGNEADKFKEVGA